MHKSKTPAANQPVPHPSRVFVVGSFVQACCWYVERVPVAGESLLATNFHAEPGGKGLNVAVGLARLGCEVSLLVGCGDDLPANSLKAVLAKEGMACADVVQLPVHSGIGCGHISADGENQIVVYPGANAFLDATHVRAVAERITGADVVYAQFEAPDSAIREAFRIAAEAGVKTVLNPSPWRYSGDALRATTEVLIVNRQEAHILLSDCHDSPAELLMQSDGQHWAPVLARLAQRWPRLLQLQITLGEQGGWGFSRPSGQGGWASHRCAAHALSAVDTVGAGDAFSSAYVSAVARGVVEVVDVSHAMQRAHRCAAQVAGGAGVLERLADAEMLARWAAANDLPHVWSRPLA